MRPVLKKRMGIEGTALYQPIFTGSIGAEGYEETKGLYDTEYVRDNCMAWEEGIGKVFIEKNSKVGCYSRSPSTEWLPERSYSYEKLGFGMQLLTLEWQGYIIDKMVESSIKLLSREKKRELTSLINLSKYENRTLLEILGEVKRH